MNRIEVFNVISSVRSDVCGYREVMFMMTMESILLFFADLKFDDQLVLSWSEARDAGTQILMV